MKFPFSGQAIENLMKLLLRVGQGIDPVEIREPFLRDLDDKVFYEVVILKWETVNENKDVYLVTGNLKHYLIKPFIVMPSELLEIIKLENRSPQS